MSKYGVDLPRTSASQAEAGSHVAKADLRKGDLVFFNTYGPAGSITHVAIYMGDGKIANALSKKVEINDLNDDYFSKRYITARRVLTDEQYEAIHDHLNMMIVTTNNEVKFSSMAGFEPIRT